MDDKELETLEYLRNIVEAYEEIASIRMRRVKHSVLENRRFLDGVRRIFYQVKYSYKKELEKLGKEDEYIRDTNGKQVSVFLSANTGLYGSIIADTFNKFRKHVRSTETDVVVVGRVGRRMFESLGNKKEEYKYFELSDSGVDKEHLQELLEYLLHYEKITVFHGRFKDILVQEPAAISISGDIVDADAEAQGNVQEGVRYLFEPSLEEVMEYFEKEILAAIFEHSVYESNLSKYASRMINLDRATERINDKIEDVSLDVKKAKHRTQNRKQLTLLASVLRGGK